MVMLNSKTYAPSSYIGSPRFTRMERTTRTTFSDGEKYPTTKEVRLLLTLRLVSVVVTGLLSRTGIFHVLFALFFLTLTNTILQILPYPPHHTRSKPFRLLTQFTDNQENACIKPMT